MDYEKIEVNEFYMQRTGYPVRVVSKERVISTIVSQHHTEIEQERCVLEFNIDNKISQSEMSPADVTHKLDHRAW